MVELKDCKWERDGVTYSGAIRLTHMPTGITVEVNEHRSEFRNREMAFNRLKEKLDLIEKKELRDYDWNLAKDMDLEGFKGFDYKPIKRNTIIDWIFKKFWK